MVIFWKEGIHGEDRLKELRYIEGAIEMELFDQ